MTPYEKSVEHLELRGYYRAGDAWTDGKRWVARISRDGAIRYSDIYADSAGFHKRIQMPRMSAG